MQVSLRLEVTGCHIYKNWNLKEKVAFARKFSTESNIALYNCLFKYLELYVFIAQSAGGRLSLLMCLFHLQSDEWISVNFCVGNSALNIVVYHLCNITSDLIETQIILLCFLQCDWSYKKLEKYLQLLFTFFDITNT